MCHFLQMFLLKTVLNVPWNKWWRKLFFFRDTTNIIHYQYHQCVRLMQWNEMKWNECNEMNSDSPQSFKHPRKDHPCNCASNKLCIRNKKCCLFGSKSLPLFFLITQYFLMKIIWQSSGLIQLFKNTCIIIAFLQWRCWIKKTHITAADESCFHVCTDVCTDVGRALDSFSYCKRQFKHRYESVYLLYLIPVSIKPVFTHGEWNRVLLLSRPVCGKSDLC